MDFYDVSDIRFLLDRWDLDANELGDKTPEIDIDVMIAKPLFVN